MISPFVFIAGAVLCNSISTLLDRHVARVVSPVAFAWLTQMIALLVFLPFAIANWALPTENIGWIALAISGALWTCAAISVYTSIKKTEVSLREPVSQSKLIWALLLSIFVLGETPSTIKIIGTIIIFASLGIALFHPERRLGRLTDSGVLWTLGYALLGAILAVADKFALRYWKPEVYGFLVYLIPGTIITILIFRRIADLKHLLNIRGKTAVTSILLSSGSYFFTLQSYARADLTLAYPLLALATIFAVFGSMIFLGEKEHRTQRIAAIFIAIIGAILVKLG